jgi:purine nucleosidase
MTSAPLMIDVDTGVDDAAALAFAVGMNANLVAVSTVAGNVNIDLSTRNTLRVLHHLGADSVPVYRGASRPLARSLHHAPYVHGEDGLAGAKLRETSVTERELTAPEAIIRLASEHAGKLIYVSLGPATNLAFALSLRPEIATQISRVVIMGGAYFNPGNRTEHAEFNAYIDPDALRQVYQADWREIYAIGLDVTHEVEITESQWRRIPEHGQPAAEMVRSIAGNVIFQSERGQYYLHDPLAVGVALDPTLVSVVERGIDVQVSDDRRGQTVVQEDGTVRVARTVESSRYLQQFCAAVSFPDLVHEEGL